MYGLMFLSGFESDTGLILGHSGLIGTNSSDGAGAFFVFFDFLFLVYFLFAFH